MGYSSPKSSYQPSSYDYDEPSYSAPKVSSPKSSSSFRETSTRRVASSPRTTKKTPKVGNKLNELKSMLNEYVTLDAQIEEAQGKVEALIARKAEIERIIKENPEYRELVDLLGEFGGPKLTL